ncbi:MAG: response regulator [Candidatus Eisenbacteria bacterium]|uniref:Response regulator n=1 Tax=Eiseniibacteriota bacterium TaxID=2212470 RepID=A0A956LZN8_UNCEI|nr:response regulator [Candidatus Eisenbacteria bacterium]
MAEPRRILVVDDEIYILHILEFSLSMEGYEVVTASDGNEAVKRLEECDPDMVVLDVMMPGLDGYAVCRQLRASDHLRSIPVILLSAKGRSVDREAGLEAGADEYIVKPFSPRHLLERIRELFESRHLDQASSF